MHAVVRVIYTISIYLYTFLIFLASPFKTKAKKWIKGRKGLFKSLKKNLNNTKPVAWFHCASLGEFEQGRPIIEKFKEQHPGYQILLTFFSPSGYEIRKNTPAADYVCYLPADTRKNARKFISIAQPDIVVFVKYEYWYNLIFELHQSKIPIYIVSAIFRQSQPFFAWYGAWFRKHLKLIDGFFVQNSESLNLLQQINIEKVTVSGDTRFDRVFEIRRSDKIFSEIEEFVNNQPVVLGGSTWPEDEDIILSIADTDARLIIAPHETDEKRIANLVKKIHHNVIRYTEINDQQLSDYKILIIDTIGMLSQLYKYATIAFIGGGFGKGIHNILEAVTFGVPVFFGPEYLKFREATELISLGGAFEVKNKEEYQKKIPGLLHNRPKLEKASQICRDYIDSNRGATSIILEEINKTINEK